MHSRTVAIFAGLSLCALAGGQRVCAQDAHPPKVLAIALENIKPGKAGTPHEKTEAAVAKIVADAQWPQHYFGLNSLTGPPRALFFFPYDSFAEYGKEMAREGSGSEAASKIEQANMEDAELVESQQNSVYTLRTDLSHKPDSTVKDLHFFEITRVKVKVGHTSEWEEYLKMLSTALDKADPDRHLIVYRSAYGWENGGVWLLMAPMASIDQADKLFEVRDNLAKSMGDGDAKHLRDLAAASVESSQRNLFAVDPQMSYVWEEWAKADSFWQKK